MMRAQSFQRGFVETDKGLLHIVDRQAAASMAGSVILRGQRLSNSTKQSAKTCSTNTDLLLQGLRRNTTY